MGLFQKKIEPRCTYCARGRALSEDQVICDRKGVMSAGSSCRSFKYDPLKRVPPRPAEGRGFCPLNLDVLRSLPARQWAERLSFPRYTPLEMTKSNFYSVACGWRNSSQESFFHKPRRPPHLRRPPCSCSTAALPAGSRALTASCTAWQPLPLRRRCPGRLSPGAAAWTCQSSPPAPAPAGGPATGRPLRC